MVIFSAKMGHFWSKNPKKSPKIQCRSKIATFCPKNDQKIFLGVFFEVFRARRRHKKLSWPLEHACPAGDGRTLNAHDGKLSTSEFASIAHSADNINPTFTVELEFPCKITNILVYPRSSKASSITWAENYGRYFNFKVYLNQDTNLECQPDKNWSNEGWEYVQSRILRAEWVRCKAK